jgi:hypothetical protein
MRAVVIRFACVAILFLVTSAIPMSNETNWQAFCDLSRIRISFTFTFIFFAIFTECLESKHEFLGFTELPTGIAMA